MVTMSSATILSHFSPFFEAQNGLVRKKDFREISAPITKMEESMRPFLGLMSAGGCLLSGHFEIFWNLMRARGVLPKGRISAV